MTPRPSAFKDLVAFYGTVAFALLATWIGVAYFQPPADVVWWVTYGIGGLSLLAPAVGYFMVLGLWVPDGDVDEPCANHGRFLGWSWFEFPSQPGRRLWTRDRRRIDEILARTVAMPAEAGVASQDPRFTTHIEAAITNLGALATVMLAAGALICAVFLIFVLAMSALQGQQGLVTLVFGGLYLVVVLGTGGVAMSGFIVLYGLLTALGAALWRARGTRHRMQRYEVVGRLLRVDDARFHLAEPGYVDRLTHDAYGAVLTLVNHRETTTIRGTHPQMVDLRATVRAHHPGTGATPPERGQLTSAVRALAARVDRRTAPLVGTP